MKNKNSLLPKIKIFKYNRYKDERGNLDIIFNHEIDKWFKVKQVLFSYNELKGTIRGLHYQKKFKQSKIIRVISGKIFDVFVNINPRSKNYGKYGYAYLEDDKANSIYINKDHAHGFQTLTNNVEIVYFLDNKYSKKHHQSILYNDECLNVKWPLKCSNISKNDNSGKKFKE